MSGPGGPRSPLFGTATFSSLTEGQRSPTRFSYSDRSGTPTHLSSDSGSGAPYRSQHTRSYTDPYTYTDENSIDDDAEVEAALGVLDDELDNTEDALTEWSRATPYSGSGSGYGTGSYLGSDTFTRSDTHSGTGSPSFIPSSFIPFTNTLRDGRILSTITERTEHPSTRPTSHNFSGSGSRPNSGATDPRRSGHSRHLTEPTIVIPDRPTPPPGRRTGDLIALFEERGGSSPGVSGHTRTGSMPGPMGPRSPSPYTTTNSISMPTFGTLSGSTSYGYGSTAGYGSGSASRPSSPTKTTQSRSTPTPGGARAPGEARSTTSYTASQTYNTNTFTPSSYTPSSYTPTVTNTVTPTASPLRRPQASPRSPLTSVRNIVAAWKERSTSGSKTSGSSTTSSTPQTGSGTTETQGDGFFSLRRRAERSSNRMRDSLGGDEAGPSGFGGGGNGGQRRSGEQVPSTPRSGSTSLSSSVIPPPFDLAELGNFAQADREPLRIGLLWYLNVHAPPPYRWQRCQALLYPHMLLLSWIAPGGGRGIITLDLLNCTEVRSVPSPMHPTARDDVGTIAAREQSALAARGGDGGGGGEGQLGEMGLMEMLCPFQLLYGDGVERLGAESARERVRWVSAIWEALDRSVTIPNRSDSGSPTGSIRTIHTMTSTHSAQSTNSGSRSTTFMPPIDNIPDISDLYSLSSHSSGTGAGTRATRRLSSGTGGGTRAADDASVANNTLLYPGDPRVIAPSRSSSLRRTSSMTDLDEEFDSALRRARESRPGLGFGLSLVGTHATGSGGLVGDGSPVTVSSGPRLGRDVVITPPPSSGRRSERSSSVSDDAFFSAGGPSTNTSSYYSLGDGSTTPRKTETMTGVGSGTEVSGEMLFGITSGTGTQIVPSSLSYRGPSSASLLGDSHSGSGTGSGTLMPPSSGLSRSRAMTRRSRGGSGSDLSYSSSSQSHPSEEISDRENTATGTRSGTASGDYSYSETGYSYGYTQTRTFTQTEGYTTTGYDSGTVSRTQTPYPTSSSERDDQEEYEQERTPTSTAFETAHEHSPSMASMSDLPNIPSEYDTADVCSTTYETARRCDTESIAETAEVCKTESVSDEGFVTAAVCKTESERSSEGFVTCDVCKSDASTDYETAICRCGRKPPSEAVSEPAQLTPVTMPSPLPEIQPRLPSPLPIERRDEAIETSPIPQVSPLPVIVPVPIVVEPEPEPEPVPQPQPEPSLPPSPSPLSSLPSLQPMTPEEVPLPPSAPASVSSFSLLSSPRALSDIDLGPSVTRSIPSDSLLDVPSSLPAPSPIGPPLSVPSTPLLSSITESSVTPGEIPDSERTPTSARARSARTPSSLSVRESLWAPETDMSYESSMLRASPSVQSVALPEGADLSFDTSFLRPTASVASGESLGSAMQAYDRLSTIPESVTSTSIPSGTPSSSISAPSIPSIPSSSSSSITPTPTESEQPQPPTPSISVSFPTTSVPSVESLERSVESLESPSPSVRSATVTVTRTPSSVSTVSSLRPGWDAVSEVDWDREGEGLEEVQTEPSLLSSVRSPTIRAMSPAFIPLPSSPSISTHLQTMSTPSMSTPSISISQSTPSSNIPSIHSNLDTVSSAPIIMHDINRLLGWLNEREGDRSRDNEGLHDHMRDIERQLNELGDFIRSKEEPPTAPPPVPRKERSVGGSSVISSSSWGSIEEAGPAPAGPRPRPGTTTPTIRRHRGIPRSGRTTAPPRHEYLDVGVGASPRRVRSLTPPPYRIPSPSSLSSSVSFLSSHHSDDFSLMESEVYPVGPSEPSSPESPSSSSSSSPPSTPSPVSVGLPETVISSSVETSGPYLSKTSSEEAAETPTPRPVPVSIPVPPSPSSSPSQSSSASSSTARPRVPIDLGPLRELLSNVKDQVEALWDGQLSTNHMLDELRGRRTPAQVEQDNEELIERLQRIEDALMRMADAQARAAPSAGPPPPPARESYYDSGSETSSELDGLRRRWNQLRQDMSAPALPAPTPLRAQSSLDALMADLLRPSERPPPPLVQPPPPLVPLIFRPDPRGGRPRSISPTMQTTLPPRAATTGPRDGVYIYDRPRPVRIRRRGDHPAPVTPSTPIVHPPQPQQVPQQPPRTTTTPAPPPGQVLGDGGIGPGVPPPGMVGGPMGPPEGPDIDFLREVRRRRDPTSSGFINVETPGEQPPRPPSAPASVSQGPWYTDRPPAQDGAPPPPPLHPHGLGDMGGAPPPVPPPFAAQPGPAVLQLPPIFNDMMTLLRDNRHMHLASLDQQRELMRYMTNLNDWLDRDVNDRQDEMRGVSARVSRLSDDINRLANALRPQGVPVPPMPIFGMPPGPPAQQGQQGQAGPWVVPPPGDMGRAGTAPPGPAGMPPPGQVMPPVMPGGPPITIQPPGGGPPYWIQPGVEPPVIPGSYASPSEEGFIPSPLSVRDDRPYAPDFSAAHPPPGVYQPPAPGQPGPSRPHGEEEIFVPSPPRMHHSPRPDSRSSRSSSSYVPVPPPGAGDITIFPPPPVPTGPLHTHTPRSDYSRSTTPSTHRHSPRQEYPPPPAAPSPPTVIHAPETYIPSQRPGTPRVGSPRHPDIQPQPQPIIIGPVPPPGTVGPGFQQPGGGQQIPVIISPPMAHSPAPQIIQMHPSSRRSSRSRLESPPIVVRDDGGPYTPTHQGYPTSQPYPAPTPQPVTVITQPPPTSYGPSRRPSYRSGRETPVLVAEPVVHIPSRRSPSYSPSPGRGYRRRYSPDYYRRRYRDRSHSPDYYYRRDRDRGRSRSRSPYDDRYRYRSRSPGDYRHGTRYRRGRSRSPEYYRTRYRSRSRSPLWYRARDFFRRGRSPSSDHYRHYRGRSHSPTFYRDRDREDHRRYRPRSPSRSPVYESGDVYPHPGPRTPSIIPSRRPSTHVPTMVEDYGGEEEVIQHPDFEHQPSRTTSRRSHVTPSHRPPTEVGVDSRGRTPTRYGQPYREWSHSPTWYRTRQRYPDRSPSTDYYQHHYAGRSQSPTHYQERDRADRQQYPGPQGPSRRTSIRSRVPTQIPSREPSPGVEEVPFSHRPSRAASHAPTEIPGFGYDEEPRGRPRSRTPSYTERYRSRSHSPEWYRRRDRHAHGRSASSDYYRRHYGDRSQSPLWYRARDREERAGGRRGSPIDTPYDPGAVPPRSRRSSAYVPPPGVEDVEDEDVEPLDREPTITHVRSEGAPSISHGALPTVVHVRGSPERGAPSTLYEHPQEGLEEPYEEGAHPSELEDLRQQIRRTPSGVPFIPSRSEGGASRPTAPGTAYGEDAPLSEEGIFEEDHTGAHPIPSGPSGPGDLAYDDAERARHERFGEVERQMLDLTRATEEAENAREDAFRHNEESRDRIFEENEARRDQEAGERRDEIWRDLEGRLATLPAPSPTPVPIPTEEPIPVPAGEEEFEEHSEGAEGLGSAERPASIIETIRSSARDAAVQRDTQIAEIVKGEREETARQFDAVMEDRRRHDEELAEERQRLHEERDRRIVELEEELARVRGELDNEKQLRITEEAERREMERAETIERDEAVRQQLGDITNLVQEQRDECQMKKELNEERWNEKLTRREEKKADMDALKEMMSEMLAVQRAAKEACEEDRANAVTKSDIEKIVEDLRLENNSLREMFETFTDSWTAENKKQYDELVQIIRDTAHEQVPFNVQGYLDEFSKSLAAEVRMLLGEVGKLREEKRALQHEMGWLLCMRSKYGPGGEFDPDWKPTGGPLAAQAEPAPPPEVPPPMPMEPPRTAWRNVTARTSRGRRRRAESNPPAPPPEAAPTMDPRYHQAGGSWATWQPDPNIEYTPPPTVPQTLLAPEAPRGLFGPRSPNNSVRGG